MKLKGEQWEVDEADEDAFRVALVDELHDSKTPFDANEFQAVLARELGVFAKGEEYDYSKDMKHAYTNSLKQTTEDKIF